MFNFINQWEKCKLTKENLETILLDMHEAGHMVQSIDSSSKICVPLKNIDESTSSRALYVDIKINELVIIY